MAKVLLCDDASFMRATIRKILEAAGHEVVGEAATGDVCLDKYRTCKPDVVLMDITMPGIDGIEATKRIIEYNPEARIIMVSAMGQMVKVCEAIDAGAKDFIVKPFEPDRIVECINKYTE